MGHSQQLRLRDIRAVFHLLEEIRELRGDPQRWHEHMILGMGRLLGTRQGVSMKLSGFTPEGYIRLLDFYAAGWHEPKAAAWWQKMLAAGDFRADPLTDRMTHVPAAVATRLREEIISDEEWWKHDTTEVAVKVAEIYHHAVSLYRRDGAGEVRALAFHRIRGDRKFSMREKRILHLFTVELCRLYREGKLDVEPAGPQLTPRQREVLGQMMRGKSRKEIARQMGVSIFTVDEHIQLVYRAYGVSARAELLAKFVGGGGGGGGRGKGFRSEWHFLKHETFASGRFRAMGRGWWRVLGNGGATGVLSHSARRRR